MLIVVSDYVNEIMSQNVRNVAQAMQLYQAFIQQQIQRTAAALRNVPTLVVADPSSGQFVTLSYPQMLSEVQRQTQIGINEAVRYVRALGFTVI